MRKFFLTLFAVILFFQVSVVTAHPGRTDSKDGHTCKTNCEKWGLEYGQYHYHTDHKDVPKVKTDAKEEAKTEARNSF